MKKTLLKCSAIAAFALSMLLGSCSSELKEFEYEADWDQIRSHYEYPEWFQDAKFGIFLHWGPYCVPAWGGCKYPKYMYYKGEVTIHKLDYQTHHLKTWGTPKEFGYKDFVPMFKAEKFSADQWVKTFKDAGAKYVVPVAEHHDGFAMYDSKYTRWNSVDMGPKRDVVGEIKAACQKEGLHFGASSHLGNWRSYYVKKDEYDTVDPAYEDLYRPVDRDPKGEEFMKVWWNRTTEIIDKYEPEILWFDFCSDRDIFVPYHKKLMAYYFNMGLRTGKEVVLQNKNMNMESYPRDLIVLDIEQGRLDKLQEYPWQTDCTSSTDWGYVDNAEYKSADEMLDGLIDIVSKNGCLLLNIGPKADGTLPDEIIENLGKMGDWLGVNGEAIYSSRPWKIFGEGPTEVAAGNHSESKNKPHVAEDIRFTTNNGALYAIALGWSTDHSYSIQSLAKGNEYESRPIKNITLLGEGKVAKWEQNASALKIDVVGEQTKGAAYTFKIEF